MKTRFLLIPFLLLYCGMMKAAVENMLVIQALSGQEQLVAISQIGIIEFNQDSMFIYTKSRVSLAKCSVKDIRQLTYTQAEVSNSLDEVKSSTLVKVYPNPTHDKLIIEGNSCSNAYVFDLSGNLLFQKSLQNIGANNIDVQLLPKGEYVLLLNTQTFKFLKQ